MSRRDRVRGRMVSSASRLTRPAAPLPSGTSSVELYIETLSLNGFDPQSANALGGAIQRALLQAIELHGVPARARVPGALERVRSPDVKLASTGADAGAPIARAVYSSLGQAEGRPVA